MSTAREFPPAPAAAAARRVPGRRAGGHVPHVPALLRCARRGLGVLALLASLALLPPAPAEAQTNVSVSNLSQQTHSVNCTSTASSEVCATAFTTGGSGTDRYTLNSVILDLPGSGAGEFDVSIHNPGTGTNFNDPGTKIGNNLTGTVGSGGNRTYTASGITLNGATTYFLRVALSGGTGRHVRTTSSDTETGTTGWSIANTGRLSSNGGTSWSGLGSGRSLKFTVSATTQSTVSPPTLGTSVLSRLVYASTLRERPGGTSAWRESYDFKSGSGLTGFISPGTVTCAAGTAEIGWYKSDALTARLGTYTSIGGGIHSLGYVPTGTGEYRALAYCKSGTTYSTAVNLMRGGAVTLTLPPATMRVDRLSQTGARLTLFVDSVAWWYKGSQSGASCESVSAGWARATLSGLTQGTTYTYRAYTAAGCASADEWASVTFTTHAATLAPLTGFTAFNEGAMYLNGRPIWHYHRLEWNTVPLADHFYLRSKLDGVTGSTNCATELAGIPWTLFGLTNPYPGNFGVEHVGNKSRFKYPFLNRVDDTTARRRGVSSTGYACYQVQAGSGTARSTSPAIHLKFGNPPGDHGRGRITAINGAAVGDQGAPGQVESGPPDPVAAVNVSHKGSSLEVSWDAPSGSTHYDVTYTDTGTGQSARAAWNRAGTTLTITCDSRPGYENQHCVGSGATYTVGVRARNANGESAWVNSGPASLPVPDAVAEVRVTHRGNSLSVSWDAPSGATHYDVTYTDTGSGQNARAAWNRAGTNLTITCDSRAGYENQHCVAAGATYTVGVRARNANGESAWVNSAPASAPALSVADATAAEPGEGLSATLDFVVTLSPASSGTVTVAYATSDGTATEGSDYSETSGTLTFNAGETSKTVSVPVLPDGHDDGGETLTLTLSNPSGARIGDAAATGTITNDGPLQKEWLARFGRTVAGQAVEALQGRFAMGPDTPSHMVIAGERLDFAGAPPQQDLWREGETDGTRAEARGMDLRELLLGSSFHFTTGNVSGMGAVTGWGKALSGSSSGSLEGGLSLASETVTGVFGMDWERDRLLFGLALSESVSKGTVSGAFDYEVEGSLSMVAPYARLRAGERLSFWSVLGSGRGEMSLTRGGASQSADIAMQLVAAGGRAELLRPESGGFALALRTDAFFVRTESASVSVQGVGRLAGATGDASRVRAVLEGSRSFALAGGGSVEPSLTLGVRHDGGDAETGTGMEVGAGLSWSDPSSGITSDLRFHGLAAHEDGSYGEWGASGSLRLAPDPSGRGVLLSVTPAWGAQGQSGRVWDTQPGALVDAGGGARPGARLDTELGYGLSVSGGLTGTPYAGLGFGREDREYRLGWRLASGRLQSFSLGLEAARREGANDNAPEHRIGIEAGLRW